MNTIQQTVKSSFIETGKYYSEGSRRRDIITENIAHLPLLMLVSEENIRSAPVQPKFTRNTSDKLSPNRTIKREQAWVWVNNKRVAAGSISTIHTAFNR